MSKNSQTFFSSVLEMINTICITQNPSSSSCSPTATHRSPAPWAAAYFCLPDTETGEGSHEPHLTAHCGVPQSRPDLRQVGAAQRQGNKHTYQLVSEVILLPAE